jgi:hypothetical protein
VEKPLAKPVEIYQKISPEFERHGVIVRLSRRSSSVTAPLFPCLASLEAFQKSFTDITTLYPWRRKRYRGARTCS